MPLVLDYSLMVWDPTKVSGREDSFNGSGWLPAVNCTEEIIDADYLKLEVAPTLAKAIILAGQEYVRVDHQHGSTPAQIHAKPMDFLGGRKHWVENITSTTFDLYIDNPDSVDHHFWWGSPLDGITAGGAGGEGYKEKENLNIGSDYYPTYIVLGLWGTAGSQYFIDINGIGGVGAYDRIVPLTNAPTEYTFVVHEVSGWGAVFTNLRLGVAPVPGATIYYDFFEVVYRLPRFPEDMTAVKVHQREVSSDTFELEAIQDKYIGSDFLWLAPLTENEGDYIHDRSINDRAPDEILGNVDWATDGEVVLDFPGSSGDVIDMGDLYGIINKEAITIIIKFKNEDAANQEIFTHRVDGGSPYEIWEIQDSQLNLVLDVGGSATNYLCTYDNPIGVDGKYHIIALTWSKASQLLEAYVDGEVQSDDEATASADIDDGTSGGRSRGNVFLGGANATLRNADCKVAWFAIFNRKLSATEIKRISDEGIGDRVYVKGRHIRIILEGDSQREKVFAGIIEEIEPGDGSLFVTGGDFQRKLQLDTKTADFVDEPIEDAVGSMISSFTEITKGRVEAPGGSIEITKKFQDTYVSDGLDELARIAPLDDDKVWRWSLGYGQDLAFRPFDHADVRDCTTSIVEGTNLLYGIMRGSDLYEIANKVIAVSGLIKDPPEDEWCESLTNWSDTYCTLNRVSTAGFIRTGSYGMRIAKIGTNPWHYVRRTFSTIDATELKRFIIEFYWAILMVGTGNSIEVEIRLVDSTGDYFYYKVKDSNAVSDSLTWLKYEIELDDPNWQESGAPDWSDIEEFWIYTSSGNPVNYTYYFDGAHFEVDNKKATSTVISSESYETRTVVYHDHQIKRLNKLQDLADGVKAMLQEAAQRILVPCLGEPDLQKGRKIIVDAKSWDLDDSFYIAEAKHIFGYAIGYEVHALLTNGKIELPLELAKTMQTELRRSTLGATELVF